MTLAPRVLVVASAVLLSMVTGCGRSDDAAGSVTATPAACEGSDLAATAGRTEGTAGHVYQAIVLTNRGTTGCGIRGYPGVSFLDAQGKQIGAEADRAGDPAELVVLEPGDRAEAALSIAQPGVLPGCDQGNQTAPATKLRIYPPGSQQELLVPASAGPEICTDPTVHQLTVTAFHDV